jgi:glyoxylase-like metal-dependent hydrolase (beta-lactamase superfamily II)
VRITTIVSPLLDENCHVVATDSDPGALIVDPGAKTAARVAQLMDRSGLRPVAILLTHGHQDHVWDAVRLAERYGVEIHIHPADRFFLEDPLGALGFMGAGIRALLVSHGVSPHWRPPREVQAIETGADGSGELTLGPLRLAACHAPGHSPGSTVFEVSPAQGAPPGQPGQPASSAQTPILLTGDVLFAGGIGRTDLPGGSDARMRTSLRAVADRFDHAAPVYPGHGPDSVLGVEVTANPYLRAAIVG